MEAALNRPLPEPTERPTQSPPGSSPASPHPTPVKQERMDGMDIGGMMNPGGVNSEAMSALSEEKVISWGIVKVKIQKLLKGNRAVCRRAVPLPPPLETQIRGKAFN